MQIPRLLCGSAKSVATVCRRHVTQFLRGSPWIDADVELVSDRDAPGLILLNGSSPLLGGEEHVHAYAPFWELAKVIDSGRATLVVATRAFDEALEQPWSILGLLSQMNYRWFDEPSRADRFFAAMVRHWDTLDAVGARYTMGSRTGERLWALPHLLKYVLANRGVSQTDLDGPLPSGGLGALMRVSAARG